jgi:hypothetical protein
MTRRISIDDLCDPQLSEVQRQTIAALEANPVTLSEEAILAAARDATGLDDFGPDDFRDRLQRLVGEWNGDTRAYALKRAMLLDCAVRYATNRLLIHDLLKRHPEIHDEPIERPIIVVGMPRSGTTHLLNLLGADSRLRSTPL